MNWEQLLVQAVRAETSASSALVGSDGQWRAPMAMEEEESPLLAPVDTTDAELAQEMWVPGERAPVPRETWDMAAMGDAPAGIQRGYAVSDQGFSRVGSGESTVMGSAWLETPRGREKVVLGGGVPGRPGHEVSDIRRGSEGQPVVEVTRPDGLPYEIGQEALAGIRERAVSMATLDWWRSASEAFEAVNTSFVDEDDTISQMDAVDSGVWETLLGQQMQDQLQRDVVKHRQNQIAEAAKQNDWYDETRDAVYEGHLTASDMLGGADLEFLSSSEGHEDGRPDRMYFRETNDDGSSTVHEYSERGPDGRPELVPAETDDDDGEGDSGGQSRLSNPDQYINTEGL